VSDKRQPVHGEPQAGHSIFKPIACTILPNFST